MIRRYLLCVGKPQFKVGSRSLGDGPEVWIGVEVESIEPLDVDGIEERTGRRLISADALTPEEIRARGVKSFDRIDTITH